MCPYGHIVFEYNIQKCVHIKQGRFTTTVNLNLRASSVDRSLWIISQVCMSSYKSGFAALTEQKRSTYQMLLSLVHRVAQYIKRSNQDDIRNELLYCRLLKMSFFPYFQNQWNLLFSLGFSPWTELFREINQQKQLNSHIRWSGMVCLHVRKGFDIIGFIMVFTALNTFLFSWEELSVAFFQCFAVYNRNFCCHSNVTSLL